MTESFSRSMGFRPSTLDTHARTVEAIALSGLAPVMRPAPAPDGTRTPWIEELSAEGADLSRLVGAPVLLDHRNNVGSAVGVVTAARVEGGKIIQTLSFDESAAAAELIAKIEFGSVPGTSLGYSVQRFQAAGKRDGRPVFRAVAWTPFETSCTPLPADPGAVFRSLPLKGSNMEPEIETGASVDAPVTVTFDRAARNAEVRSIARLSGLGQAFVDAQIDADATVEASRAAAFEAMQKRSGPALSTAQIIADHTDPTEMRRSMADALAARLAPAHVRPEGRAREFVGMPLLDLASELSMARGERLSRNRSTAVDQIFERSAHSTSDFPLLLQDAVNKAMLPSYTQAAPTYRQWAAQRSFNDFRAHRFLRMGDFPALTEIGAEGGEPTFGSVSENRETVTPKEFGSGISINRRALVNDDLGVLQNFTGMIGARVAADENAWMYQLLASNPTLSDGMGVFHAGHGNLPAAADIDAASIAAIVASMRKQESVDGIPLNIAPRYLVIGPGKELKARQLLASIIANQTSNVNPWSGMLELIVDANVSGNKWYVFADPGAYPVFIYGYVGGTSGPVTRSEICFKTRSMNIAVGLDFARGAIDHIGAAYNSGN